MNDVLFIILVVVSIWFWNDHSNLKKQIATLQAQSVQLNESYYNLELDDVDECAMIETLDNGIQKAEDYYDTSYLQNSKEIGVALASQDCVDHGTGF